MRGDHTEGRTMPITIDMSRLLALPPAERIAIADALYDSVPDDEVPPHELSDELKAELDRRLEEHRANPDDVIPWEEIKRDSLARAKRRA
jgi:putative addiction module component (TIGR02574 family)